MLATAFAPEGVTIPRSSIDRRVQAPATNTLADRFSHSNVRSLAPKEHLFCAGDPATHVYQVESGHLCIYRTMMDGRRQVVDFAYPGDVLGLGALGEHGTSAQATVRTTVRCLALSSLVDSARRDPKLGMQLYETLSHELQAARELLFTVSQKTASERLASFLLALSRRNARRGEKPNEIVLPMTRSDIADFLGLTIETVSRTFTRFRTDKIIDIEQCILVTISDPRRLEDIAESKGECGA